MDIIEDRYCGRSYRPPRLITAAYLKEGAVVVEVGTSVSGGLGPVTSAVLPRNTAAAARSQTAEAICDRM
jgi:5,10-methylene-tetrahydrofolate dehydrogenase/methenyl tetrahydrofolate cyclohydrolase